jgi:hypothetical protein
MAWVAARIPSTHGALASLGRKPPANLERILCGERNELPRDGEALDTEKPRTPILPSRNPVLKRGFSVSSH